MKFQIADSNERGGKAGRGRNKTATIQVREPLAPGSGYLLKHQVRYAVGQAQAREEALSKARKWIKEHECC